MYSISFEDSKKFMTFLGATTSEYVDVIVSGESALFVQNTNEIFSVYQKTCSRSASAKDCAFRLRNDLLKSLATGKRLEFDVEPERITMHCIDEDDSLRYSVSTEHDEVFSSLYSSKMSLISGGERSQYFSISDLKEMQKIATVNSTSMNLDNGACGVITREGFRVYRECECQSSFGISFAGFNALRKCGSSFFEVDNYVCAVNDNFAVAVNKVRFTDNSMFFTGTSSEYGSSMIAKLKIGNLRSFIATKKLGDGRLILDLETRTCSVTHGRMQYEIPVYLADIQKSELCKTNTIEIPVSLFKAVLNVLPYTEYVLRVKQYFVQLECDGYYIMFR